MFVAFCACSHFLVYFFWIFVFLQFLNILNIHSYDYLDHNYFTKLCSSNFAEEINVVCIVSNAFELNFFCKHPKPLLAPKFYI